MMEKSRGGERYGWIWGLILIFLGGIFLLNQWVGVNLSEVIWMVIMGGISLTFVVVYLTNRSQWWALIPAYVFGAIAGLLALTTLNMFNMFSGDLIAVYVLSAIGLPFLIVYALNREHWWALIPAYVMGAVVGLLLLENMMWVRMNSGDITGAYVMFAIALPFLVVYLRNRENWWALIPGGIMLAIGLGLVSSAFEYVIPAALLLAGIILLARQFTGSRPQIVERAPERPRYGPQADRGPDEYEPLGTRGTGPDADHA